eukprot:CAMPEP_0174239452 /NCGR_PEP_ID=MMETSP0417-20130205/14749_1 /TAXON_ID=242541 /ORGANISM="Mayorella sp, Strain BSH-02190019" /LENGTH=172 /DNA_ID=CAMNT_0015318395 /DNA_START=457 /DNA_END=971 /DNA_ORIENTATION=-
MKTVQIIIVCVTLYALGASAQCTSPSTPGVCGLPTGWSAKNDNTCGSNSYSSWPAALTATCQAASNRDGTDCLEAYYRASCAVNCPQCDSNGQACDNLCDDMKSRCSEMNAAGCFQNFPCDSNNSGCSDPYSGNSSPPPSSSGTTPSPSPPPPGASSSASSLSATFALVGLV